MIKVCLNFKIHIPAVRALNEFLKTSYYLQNDSISETEKSIVEQCAANLLTYLHGLESVHLQSKGQFKAGMSINGITLMQLLKYAPEVIEQLKILHDKKCIEILSEPWSHSVIPFLDELTLARQIELHDITVQSVFGVTPQVFIVHSPIYMRNFQKTVSKAGKRAIFTNLNLFKKETFENNASENNANTNNAKVIPINHRISSMLQKLDFNPYSDEDSVCSQRIIHKVQNYVTDSNPVIAVYNLTRVNNFFGLSKFWQKFLVNLLAENKVIFNSPSEAIENYTPLKDLKNLLDVIFYHSHLDDMWLENKFQNRSFDQLLRINTMMQSEPDKELIKEWEVIQDMENLFYMNDRFKKNGFAKHYFSLFDDPDIAFFSYTNVLDKFMDKLLVREKIQKSFKLYKSLRLQVRK